MPCCLHSHMLICEMTRPIPASLLACYTLAEPLHTRLSLLLHTHALHHTTTLTDEAHYHGWSAVHGREHGSSNSYQQRLAAFKATLAKVTSHNSKAASGAADAPGHTLKVNHFADWQREEFDRVMLPKKWKREHGILEPQVRLHNCFRNATQLFCC